MTSKKVQSLHGGKGDSDGVAQRVADYQSIKVDQLPPKFGFSARLNQLCTIAGEPPLADGRVFSLSQLDENWSQAKIKKWLENDEVPDDLDLYNLVHYLVGRIETDYDPEHWRAYVVFGTPRVASPLLSLRRTDDGALAALASRVIVRITRERSIPPDSYDADEVLHRTVQILQSLNIHPDGEEIQPGHLQMIATRAFEDGPI